MRRNSAIVGRNRFMERFNSLFNTSYEQLPLEKLPNSDEDSAIIGSKDHPQEKAA